MGLKSTIAGWLSVNKNTPTIKQERAGRVASQIVKKQLYRTRVDISNWRNAQRAAEAIIYPSREKIISIYREIEMDAVLSSQVSNRIESSKSAPFVIKSKDGKVNEEITAKASKSPLIRKLIQYVVDARFTGHHLLEFSINGGIYDVKPIDQRYVDPSEETVRYELFSTKREKYKEMAEYGSWLVSIGQGDLGVFNKAVPHVLFKRFAQSCYSEFCEIYGIPPRIGKTNTSDQKMLDQMQKMMQETGSANWAVIDKDEDMQFVNAVQSDGSIFINLMRFCNSELSMLISGALIGQDTMHGTKGKEEVNLELLKKLIESDKREVENTFQEIYIPALIKIGYLPAGDYTFEYEAQEDKAAIWAMIKDAMQHYDIDFEQVEKEFGIKLTKREAAAANNLSADFFV